MAPQQGFVYEQNAVAFLKPMGFVPKGFIPAGAGHGQPDLMLLHNNKQAGCELKITDASAGSLVMKYNPKTKKWGFGNIGEEEKEKQFIRDLAEFVGLFKHIGTVWNKAPYKIDKEFQDPRWLMTVGKIPSEERYKRDHGLFKEQKGSIPATKIEEYYNKKDTYYVNIGTHGFYLFGRRNPLQLQDVPQFSQCAQASWRARVQYKGSGNYQFTFEMAFSVKVKSTYNIAPLAKSSVAIVKNAANLACFA